MHFCNTKDSVVTTFMGFSRATLSHIIMKKATQKKNIMPATSVEINMSL